jgi:hypothetical protein
MGVDAVMNLYEAMTSAGRGGAIAHTIMTYDKPAELEAWFVNATPAALGPMFKALTSEPASFGISDVNEVAGETKMLKVEYTTAQGYLLQQRAISTIISWITKNADDTSSFPQAQRQFEESCKRMNKFGTMPMNEGRAYCEGRYRLDSFMAEAVLRLVSLGNDVMRKKYLVNSKRLGDNLDPHCQVTKSYDPFYRGTSIDYID